LTPPPSGTEAGAAASRTNRSFKALKAATCPAPDHNSKTRINDSNVPQREAEALKKRNAQGNNQKNIPPPRTATIQQQRTQTSQRNQPVEKQTKKTKNSPRKQLSHHETRKHKVTHAKRNTINQKKQARKHESRSTCHRAADA
jgi:hypothetical protein